MRIVAIAAAAGFVLLAGCDDQTDPSPPPTTEDALTTVTTAPTTTPPDEVELTTDAAPTTAEPTTTEPVADDGPPEMPPEAQEQTQAGAESFAMHYMALLNYTGRHPETGLLEPLAADGCLSCANYEESVSYNVVEGHYLLDDTFITGSPSTVFTGDGARVSIPVQQKAQNFHRDGEPVDREVSTGEAKLIVRVAWNDEWQVSEITVEQ